MPIQLPREPPILAWWWDLDFDPAENAVYYVRVLKIPTPSWLAYDKVFYVDAIDLPENAVMVQKERAFTLPICFAPQ